jgi:hypothetical protein
MKYLIVLILLITFSSSFGQKDGLRYDSLTKQLKSNTANDKLNEVEAYKLLYQTAQNSNDNLRSTTQWTIGIVIAFILLILGSQFLYNWRLNKQEVETIKSEMETKFQELQNQLSKQREEMFNDLKVDISNSTKENKAYLRDKYFTYREINAAQLETYKTDIEKQLTQLKANLEEHEGDIWLLKGVEANALSAFIRTAHYKFEINQELKYTFDDIIPLLSKAEEIHELDFNNLEKLIKNVREKFGSKYNEQLSSIEKNYKGKPLYVYEDSRLGGALMPGLMSPFFRTKKIIKK